MSTSTPASSVTAQPARTGLRAREARARLQRRLGPRAGLAGLAVITVITLLMVLDATAGPSILVPRSGFAYPGWEAGPLGHLVPEVLSNRIVVQDLLSAALAVLFLAWLVVLGALPSLSRRTIWIVVIALHVILLLGPPTQLTDMFNYLGYARLGGAAPSQPVHPSDLLGDLRPGLPAEQLA